MLDSGEKVGNPRYFAKDEKKWAKAQRRLAKKQLGAKNRDQARKKVARIHARIHARIADRRRDFARKLSTRIIRIIRENQTICLERLQVKNMVKAMVKHPTLAKAMHEGGWGEFVRQLEYKAVWYGRTLITIDRWYPSSKRCHSCGHMLDCLPLAMRSWTCPECGAIHDRDVNAAQNILAVGRTTHGGSLWRDGKTDQGFGPRRHISVKEESPGLSQGEGQFRQSLLPLKSLKQLPLLFRMTT